VLLGLLVVLGGSLVATPPATASISILCEGYAGCREDGMGNGRYAANRDTMYWRMYSGHNCTNYAAYRLVRNGMPDTRPWEGSGNASNWGYAMDEITDTTPAVGAIAWWKAYAPGAGSSGHVAYVEEVLSSGTIIVSQDSWGGDFSWARITKSGTGWPSGFIHFKDLPLLNTAAPVIQGTVKVGSTLTATGGRWKPGDPTLAYQWRRNGRRIDGATSATYVVPRTDKGDRLSVRVTATKLGYPTESARSEAAEVLPGDLTATSQPTVTGQPVVDGTLTATPPTWNVTPGSQSYQWLAGGNPVDGATTPTFRPGPAHEGLRIKVRVTATAAGYDPATTTSVASEPVSPATITPTGAPTVSGVPRPGEVLTLDPGTASPETEATVTWLRDGQVVEGATGPTYAVSAADLGGRIAAQVTRTRAGYTTLVTRTGQTARVRTPAAIELRHATPGGGRVRLVALVTSPDVAPVTGQVRFRSGRQVDVVVDLVDGRAVADLLDVPLGTRTFKVRYLGSPQVTRAVLDREIRVR
jgi:surface antigen